MSTLTELSPEAFAARLAHAGGRGFVVRNPDTDALVPSHAALGDVVEFLDADRRDHDRHEGIFFEVGRGTGALHTAFVHRTCRGQAAGGVRHWPYQRMEDLMRDGLRLSQGMTRKNALAGLWWGGGKGVIARQSDKPHGDPDYRRTLYAEYGKFVSSIAGCYVTAEDAGTTPPDMAVVFAHTRHTTCIPADLGGSGNPSEPTAKGVVCAMEGALDFVGLGTLEGKTIAMEGAGNVAGFMIDELLARGVARIVASEISRPRVEQLTSRKHDARLEIRPVEPGDLSIFDQPCDVFAPNALGGSLNPETIPRLKAKIVCGAANNQLLDDRRDARALGERGIVYVPDFLCNRMGIVNCANEQYGRVPDDPAIERHLGRDWENSVFVITQRVLRRASDEKITPAEAARALADELSLRDHPIWPHRARDIMWGLVKSGWHEAR
jgi:glutamate dehydrogenase/leucine dehydrogenase